MLIVSNRIDASALLALLTDGSEVVFAESQCVVQVNNGRVIGDSPYGYIDFMGPVSDVMHLVHWARSWTPLMPSNR